MLSADTRRVRRVRMHATSDTLVRRGVWLLEDALHTASLPGAAGRLLLVRSLDCGKIRRRGSPAGLAVQIEERFRKLAASAVHAETPHAVDRPAVYFRSDIEAHALLATRLSQAQDVGAWFWPLAVPTFSSAAPRHAALRSVFLAAAAMKIAPLATLTILQTLLEKDSADALLCVLNPADGAVLLLDEADSFLMDRRGAHRTYEVTEVNEMLQGMERFKGVFICTTNLFDRIDEAALRRFTFKIQFKPLTREQREKMFVTEALDGNAANLSGAMADRLNKLQLLTPGDFAAVKRQITLLDETMTPDEFLAQLEQEHKVKPDVKFARSIGF